SQGVAVRGRGDGRRAGSEDVQEAQQEEGPDQSHVQASDQPDPSLLPVSDPSRSCRRGGGGHGRPLLIPQENNTRVIRGSGSPSAGHFYDEPGPAASTAPTFWVCVPPKMWNHKGTRRGEEPMKKLILVLALLSLGVAAFAVIRSRRSEA